jgi:hypothetical protein
LSKKAKHEGQEGSPVVFDLEERGNLALSATPQKRKNTVVGNGNDGKALLVFGNSSVPRKNVGT